MTLEVREGNRAARALYEEAGLKPVGLRRGYYSESGEHAVIMWTDELDHPGEHARMEELTAAGDRALAEFDGPGEVVVGDEIVLAIETSCDETAAAVMRGGTRGAVLGRCEPGRLPCAFRRRRSGDRLAQAHGGDRRRRG